MASDESNDPQFGSYEAWKREAERWGISGESGVGIPEVYSGRYADEQAAAQQAEREGMYLTARDPSAWTDSEKLWLMAYSEFDQAHRTNFGIPMNRPWRVDVDAQRDKLVIDDRARQLAAEYADQLGPDFAWDESLFGVNAQPNEPIQQRHRRRGFGGLLSSVVDFGIGMIPALSMAAVTTALGLGPIGAGMAAGATNPALQGGDVKDVLKGAAIGGATAGAGQYAGEYTAGMLPDSPWMSQAAAGGAGALTGATLSGGNPLRAGAAGAIMGGISGWGDTPSQMDSGSRQPVSYVEGGSSIPAEFLPQIEPMMMRTPENAALLDQLIAEQPAGPTIEAFSAQASPEMQALLSGMGVEPAPLPPVSDADMEAAATEEALTGEASVEGEEPTAEAPTEKEMKAKDYVKIAKKVYDFLKEMRGGDAPSVEEFVLPEQEEGQSDEEYLAEISDLALGYLGLDVDAMKDAGYEPGTQEYLDYVLAYADKVIAAAFGDADPAEMEGKSVEELQQTFRGKSEKEMEALARALYVRGALGAKSFKESAIDPFTGELEYLGEGEKETAPAATQRGYARFLEETAGLSAPEARRSIKGLLDRDIDLFDLGAARKARTLDDMLAEFNATQPVDEEDDDLYERRGGTRRATRGRGMLPAASNFWQQFRK
jgi:hypothetical protein